MREIILSKDETSMRDILVAVILLSIHETFVDRSISPSGSWLSHVGGASMLMKKHSESKSKDESPIDLQIRSTIFRQMLHGSLSSGRSPVISPDEDVTLQDPRLRHVHAHSSLLHQAALLNTRWRTALDNVNTPNGLDALAGIASEAMALDEKLKRWAADLPGPFGYVSKPIELADTTPAWVRELVTAPGAPRASHVPVSPVGEMLWRFYWETRMILYQALLHTDNVLDGRGHSSVLSRAGKAQIESSLMDIIDRLCESCITPLIKSLEEADSDKDFKIEDFRSIRAYLMLQILPTTHICLSQITLHSVQSDTASRRSWLQTMKDFVQFKLGFSKAAAEVDMASLILPIQLWSLANGSPGPQGIPVHGHS
ncbi:hypothetical protein CC79DRAFT_1327888 [Sarocladium strictum]